MIFKQLSEQLSFLNNVLSDLSSEQYSFRSKYLGESTIGGHTRHILEILNCVIAGYEGGYIDYENRKRDMTLEQDILVAAAMLARVSDAALKPDKSLWLDRGDQLVATSYFREIVYNLEHTIHHLALIKVALLELGTLPVDVNFGMAYSTIKFKEQQLQVQ